MRLAPLSFLLMTVPLAVACSTDADKGDAVDKTGACDLPAACTAVTGGCLGKVDNKGQASFGLRVAELEVRKPTGLAAGVFSKLLATAVLPSRAECFVKGTGDFSLLLRIDRTAERGCAGVAEETSEPAGGYTFATGNFPASELSLAPGAGGLLADLYDFHSLEFGTFPLNLPVPMAGGTLLLPLRDVRVKAQSADERGTISQGLSNDDNCIGQFSTSALDATNACAPKADLFTHPGILTGIIELERADAIEVPGLQQSLCALIAGDGEGLPVKRCKRSNGVIAFRGDACTIPFETSCTDAVAVELRFAASSVKVAGECPK